MKRLTRALAVVFVVMAVTVVVAPAAGAKSPLDALKELAGVGDCKNAPVPTRPDAGNAMWVDPAGRWTNDDKTIPPEHPDPFEPPIQRPAPVHPPDVAGPPAPAPAPIPTPTLVDYYGMAGLFWSTYDISCVPGMGAAQGVTTEWANTLFSPSIVATSVTGQFSESARQPGWLNVFDPLFEKVTAAMSDKVFLPLFPLAVLGLAAFAAASIHRHGPAELTRHLAWLAVILVVVGYLWGYPLQAGRHADQLIGLGTTKVHDAMDNGQGPMASVATIHREILYKTWCAGMVGSAEGPTADKYCPRFFRAQAISRFEWQRIRGNADGYKETVERKQAEWKQAAEELQGEDPIAYETLKGEQSGNRLWGAVGAGLGTVFGVLFVFLAAAALFVAWWIIRLSIVLAGFPALLAVFPGQRHHLRAFGRRLGLCGITAVQFTFFGAFIPMCSALILNASLVTPVKWLLLILGNVLALVMLRPVHSITTMVRGHHAPMLDLKKMLSTAIGTAAGAAGAEALGADTPTSASPPPKPTQPREDRPQLVSGPANGAPGPSRSTEITPAVARVQATIRTEHGDAPSSPAPSTRPIRRYEVIDTERTVSPDGEEIYIPKTRGAAA